MPSPVFRLLTTHLPLLELGQGKGQTLVEDLRKWEFDANETFEQRLLGSSVQPCSLLQAFLAGLPRTLTEKSDAAQVVRDIVDTLLLKGADATVLDQRGVPVEELAPAFLRAKLVRARGGDVQRDQDIQDLKILFKQTMPLTAAVDRLKDREDDQGNHPHTLGQPLVLWVLANASRWATANLVGDTVKAPSGEASIARARSSQTRQLIRWAQSLPADQAELAEFLGWCVAYSHCKTDGSRGEHWDKLLDKLEPDDESHAKRLRQADVYLGQDFGDLTGHVAQTIAQACSSLGDTQAVTLWARAMGRLYEQRGALDTERRACSTDKPYSLPNEWRDLVSDRLRRGAPAPGSIDAQAWLDFLPVPLGTTLVMRGLFESHKSSNPPRPERQPPWRAWATEWLAHHPSQTAVLRQHLDAHAKSLPAGTAAELDAWLLDLTLAEPSTTAKAKPRF